MKQLTDEEYALEEAWKVRKVCLVVGAIIAFLFCIKLGIDEANLKQEIADRQKKIEEYHYKTYGTRLGLYP